MTDVERLRKHGQIGVVFNFAVFPDRESGHLALLDVLKITYGDSSMDEMMDLFAPPSENNTVRYKKFLHEVTGVKDNRKINAFSLKKRLRDKHAPIFLFHHRLN
jgi:hypothetical protein